MRAAVVDIETTALEGIGAGSLLVCCIKPLGKPITTLRLDELHCRPGKEVRLIQEILKALSQFDLIIGHNIDKFDFDYIKTRAVVLGIPFPLRPLSYDTLKAFKRSGLRTRLNGFGKPSAGLAMVVDLFGFKQEKTAIYPREWWEAIWGNRVERTKALDNIADHCQRDVRMNEKIYNLLLPIDVGVNIKRLR